MKIIQFQGLFKSVQIPNEDIKSIEKLNHDQMVVFNIIMNVIDH